LSLLQPSDNSPIELPALRIINHGGQKLRSLAVAVHATALFFEWARLTFDRLMRGPDAVIIAARLQVKGGSLRDSPLDKSGARSPLDCVRKEVEIVNKLGLHARPAALFVRCVIKFKSTITIWKGEENYSAASLLEVLTANLDCGARVVLEAVGADEQEALNELEALLQRFRDEESEA
jgi:phosphocarrier protein HPr